jgi:predicted permease
VVWAPILGLILVLAGVTLPSLAKGSIKQIGDTTGGVALFTLGVLLSPLKIRVDLATIAVVLLKNLVMPAIAFALSRLFGLDGLLTKGAIIAAACPAATIGAMFSAKFQIGQKTVPAEILASNIVGIASMAFWIFIVEEMR